MSLIIMAFQTAGLKPFMDYEIYVHNFWAQLEFFSEKEQNKPEYIKIFHTL